MEKPVNFMCQAPRAKAVFLAGDFNGWHPRSHPMERMPDGAWATQVPLSHGHHHYFFLVDGKPTLDPKAYGTVRDQNSRKISLIAIS